MGSNKISNGTISNGNLGSFSPLVDGVAFWIDVTDWSTIKSYLNESNKVAGINDKSGNGYHPIQTTELDKPLYLPTGFNGTPGIHFVEADTTYIGLDMAGTFISDPSITGQMTIIAVFNNALNPGTRIMFDSGSGNNLKGLAYGCFSLAERSQISSTTEDWISPSNQWAQSTNTILSTVWDGTTMSVYNNGSLNQTTAAGANTGVDTRTTFNIGTGSIKGLYLDFVLSQLLIFPTALTAEQRIRNEAYVAMRAGL